jgi:uncharacterized protein (TIGR03437 family)
MRAILPILLYGAGSIASAQTFAVVSAATYERNAPLSPAMIATGFTQAITAPVTAATMPLPSTLAGYAVSMRDAAGRSTSAQLLSVAPGQISFLVPEDIATGTAVVTLRGPSNLSATATVTIAAAAPGIFTANASGSGAPAGLAVSALPDGSQRTVELFSAAQGGMFLPRPISLGAETYLVLYGTGIRGRRDSIVATVAGKTVPIAAAVAHSQYAGLDQVNVGPLSSSLGDSRGEVELVLTIDGRSSNRVSIGANEPEPGQWGSRARLMEANSEMAVGEVAGRILVMGGYPASRQTRSTVQLYDPVTDSWELGSPMPVALNHNMTASVGGKLYMIGGQTTDAGAGNFSDRVFEYDPATRTWRERARMPTARGAGVAIAVDGKIYVAGGRPPRGADFAVYDPAADSWRTLPDLPTARNHLAGAALGGKVYVVGGRFEGGFQSPQSDAVEVYDPVSNTWSTRARMLKPRGGINGLEANGCLHVFGGEGNASAPNGVYPDHDVYNPVTDAWTSTARMPIPIHGVTGAVFLNGLIYLPGGGTSEGGNSGGLQHQVYRPNIVCR